MDYDYDYDFIIDSFGELNDELNTEDLNKIQEELETLNKKDIFELTKIAILLGKPQILEILLDIHCQFNAAQINTLKKTVETYANNKKELVDNNIICDFEKIITNYRKLPYKRN